MVDPDRVMGKVKEVGGAVQGTVGDALGSPGNSVEGRFREAEGKVENLFGHARDAVRRGVDEAAGAAQDAYANAGPHARQGVDVAREQVGDHPLTALMLAGAAGYILALLIHGRH